MVSINSVVQKSFLLINKAQGGGYASDDDVTNFCNIINTAILNEDYERFQETQKLTDRVKSFIRKKQLYAPNTGQLAYPKDYFYFVALRTYKYDQFIKLKTECEATGKNPDYSSIPQVTIKSIDNDKLGILNQSEIYQPSVRFPYAVFYDEFIQIYPIDLGYCTLDYIQQPMPVKWATVIDPQTGLPVYDPINSIDFEWDATVENEIIKRFCQLFSVEVREEDLTKLSTVVEQG